MRKELLIAMGTGRVAATRWHPHLEAAADCYGIDTPIRQAAWLSQVLHESGLLSVVEENLNYSAERLLQVFPKYFTAETAPLFSHKPEKIANLVYGNRMGNGPAESGDGWRYRGRGLMQITGKDSYREATADLGINLVGMPEILTQDRPAAMSAGWEWQKRDLNSRLEDADPNDLDQISDIINIGHVTKKIGDSNGYAERLALWIKAKTFLGI